MKKILVVVVVMAVALFGASVAMAGIVGSAHDLSAGSGGAVSSGNGADEVCIHCHTPHGGTNVALIFDSGRSALFNKTVGAGNAGSNTCMACHDGTIGTLTNNKGRELAGDGDPTYDTSVLLNTIWTSAITGDSHPIGVANPTGAGWHSVAVSATTAGFIGGGTGTVECSSCHDAHGAAGLFLRESNAGSAICLRCHDK